MERPMRSLGSRLVARWEVPTLLGPSRGQRTPLRQLGARSLFETLAGRYEHEQSAFLVERLASASSFLDIGAAQGHFVRLACRVMPLEAAIFAFEPDPVPRRALEKLAAQQPPRRVQVRREALANEDSIGRLLVAKGSCGRLAGVGFAPPPDCIPMEGEVTIRSIDSLVAAGEIPSPDVVKIDTEGAELSVLAGMSQTLASRRPVLVVECHSMPLLRDILSVALESGYRELRVTRGGDGVGPPSVLASG